MNQESFPLISVIIPVFNRAESISACIDSVIYQDYPDLEIIVVDDSSTDNIQDVLLKYDQQINIITLNKNQGAQAARNTGIRSAKYDWIAFLDSDDQWMPDKLFIQIEELKKANMDRWTVIHGDCCRMNTKTNFKKYWELPFIDGANVYQDLLKHPSPMFQAMLTSKIALEKIGFLDEHLPTYQEWDTAISLSKYCRFIHIRQSLFIYNVNTTDAISSDDLKAAEGYNYVIKKHRDEIINNCGEKIYNSHLIINAILAMNCKQFKIARDILSNSLSISWKRFFLYLISWLQIRPKLLLKYYSKFRGV